MTWQVGPNGQVLARYLFDPFGNELAAVGPLASANLYRFSSKELHPPSGLVYYGYRFYDPSLQRWVNRDPIADTASLAFADYPQSFKTWAWVLASDKDYGFVHNNPVSHNDYRGAIIGHIYHCAICFATLHSAYRKARQPCKPYKDAYQRYMIEGTGNDADFDPEEACRLKKAYVDCYLRVLRDAVSAHCFKCALWHPRPPRL